MSLVSSESLPVSPESLLPDEGYVFCPLTHEMLPEERTQILKGLNVQLKVLEQNINYNTPDQLMPIIEEADRVLQDGTLEEKVKNSEEVILDSEVIRTTSHIMNRCTSDLFRKFSKYDPNGFADKILQHVRSLSDAGPDGRIEWSLFGREIMGCFKKTPKFSMLLGTLRKIPKKEVTRHRGVREAPAPIKRPETVMNVEKVEDSIEETVSVIWKLIHSYKKHNKEPLDFLTLVLHPTNYGKTIENMLHTSFLVNDGLIKFTVDKDGIPYVDVCSSAEKDQSKKNSYLNSRSIHNVLSLNMRDWKALVEAYGITKPMIDLDIKKSKSDQKQR